MWRGLFQLAVTPYADGLGTGKYVVGDCMSKEMNVELFLKTLAKLWGEMEGVDVEVTFVEKQKGGDCDGIPLCEKSFQRM